MFDFITKRANSTIEFSLLMAMVILAIISMQPYLKRSIAGGWRRQIDQMAGQFSPEHENITMMVTEFTNQTEGQRGGFTSVNVTQTTTRITDEEIEPLNVGTRIGI